MKKNYLNLYSGLLGNVTLLDELEWDITNIEFDEKIHKQAKLLKPNQTHILADAHQYLLDHYKEFDFIWSSPPCQRHSKMNKATRHNSIRYVDGKLFEEIIFLKTYFKGKWVVENVVPYYDILLNPTRLGRHLFWSNFEITSFEMPAPPSFINLANNAGKKVMMDWLGIHYDKNIYYGTNHCPVQILRNCVHPKTGLHVLNCSIN